MLLRKYHLLTCLNWTLYHEHTHTMDLASQLEQGNGKMKLHCNNLTLGVVFAERERIADEILTNKQAVCIRFLLPWHHTNAYRPLVGYWLRSTTQQQSRRFKAVQAFTYRQVNSGILKSNTLMTITCTRQESMDQHGKHVYQVACRGCQKAHWTR